MRAGPLAGIRASTGPDYHREAADKRYNIDRWDNSFRTKKSDLTVERNSGGRPK